MWLGIFLLIISITIIHIHKPASNTSALFTSRVFRWKRGKVEKWRIFPLFAFLRFSFACSLSSCLLNCKLWRHLHSPCPNGEELGEEEEEEEEEKRSTWFFWSNARAHASSCHRMCRRRSDVSLPCTYVFEPFILVCMADKFHTGPYHAFSCAPLSAYIAAKITEDGFRFMTKITG